ncbi:MAG: hypothetical protein HOP25_09835 [Methylotenera sp.]|nr:hypothetical protein [Methylotenera sp.]
MAHKLVEKNIMEQTSNANGSTVLVMVKNKELKYAEFIKAALELKREKLVRGRKYLSKEIVGVDVWELLEKGEQLQIGREMAYMAEHKLIPLTAAGKNTANAILYTID